MSAIKPRFKSNHSPVFSSDNLLKQKFNPKSPNQVWTTDLTYISIEHRRHVYLCTILNLYSRKCIAWKVSDRIDAKLACDTLKIAISKRKPKQPIIKQREINRSTYHSIQEVQLSCFE